MIRLFVAIPLPDALRTALEALGGGVPGARWTPAENMHLTLRFVGEVDEGVAADIDEALDGIAFDPFALALQGVGAFDDRLIWAGVADATPVIALRRKVEAAIARAGLPREGRKFAPHVTLARLKHPDMARVAAFLSGHALLRSDPFTIGHFGLFSSMLGGEQAIHTEERRYDAR